VEFFSFLYLHSVHQKLGISFMNEVLSFSYKDEFVLRFLNVISVHVWWDGLVS
jgi:hypothetical protein